MKKEILLTAEPYAFGPSSKMMTIARALRDDCHITILGRDIVQDYAASNGFACEPYVPQDLERLLPLLRKQDAVLNVMNFEIDSVLRQSAVPTVYLDTLFWFWNTPVWRQSRPVRYFCQNFPGTRLAVANTLAPFRDHISVVGPVVDASRARTKAKQKPRFVLVNFGGLESDFVKIGSNSNYPTVVLDAILDDLLLRFDLPIMVTTRGSVAEMLQRHYAHIGRVTFVGLSQCDFLDTLCSSICLFTTPGLETLYEAFLHEIPVFFLPPSLNSQYHQLEVYEARGVADFRLEWLALAGRRADIRSLSLEEQTAWILRTVCAPESIEQLRSAAAPAIEAFAACVDDPRKQILAQTAFMRDIGENGVSEICDALMLV